MQDLPQSELLSAYLDGELTAAEQDEVEQLLASSPAARQLLDELRAVSTTLQGMPQYPLGEDLTDGILRAAERRILTGAADSATAEEAVAKQAEGGETGSGHELGGDHVVEGVQLACDRRSVASAAQWLSRRLLRPQILAWPAAAVVVAIVLMLNEPRGPRIALAPNNGSMEKVPGNEPIDNQSSPTGPAAGGEVVGTDIDDAKADRAKLEGAPRPRGAIAKSRSGGSTRRSPSPGETFVGPTKGATPSVDPPPRAVAKGHATNAPEPNTLTASRPIPTPFGSARRAYSSKKAGIPGKSSGKSGAVTRPIETVLGSSVVAGDAAVRGTQNRVADGDLAIGRDLTIAGANAQQGDALVFCSANRSAIENGAFRRVLASNRIAFNEDSVRNGNIYIVEATRKQIVATVAELNANRESFATVDIVHVPWTDRAMKRRPNHHGVARADLPENEELRAKTWQGEEAPREGLGRSIASKPAASETVAEIADEDTAPRHGELLHSKKESHGKGPAKTNNNSVNRGITNGTVGGPIAADEPPAPESDTPRVNAAGAVSRHTIEVAAKAEPEDAPVPPLPDQLPVTSPAEREPEPSTQVDKPAAQPPVAQTPTAEEGITADRALTDGPADDMATADALNTSKMEQQPTDTPIEEPTEELANREKQATQQAEDAAAEHALGTSTLSARRGRGRDREDQRQSALMVRQAAPQADVIPQDLAMQQVQLQPTASQAATLQPEDDTMYRVFFVLRMAKEHSVAGDEPITTERLTTERLTTERLTTDATAAGQVVERIQTQSGSMSSRQVSEADVVPTAEPTRVGEPAPGVTGAGDE